MRHPWYQDRQPRPHDACRPGADRLRAGPPAEPRSGAPCRGPPPVRRVDAAPDAGRARRFGPAYPFGTGTQAHRSRRVRRRYQYFQRLANFFGTAQLCDGKIKIGAWIRFVFQRVMPPLAVVPIKTAVLHDRAKVLTVSRFGWRDFFCSMM